MPRPLAERVKAAVADHFDRSVYLYERFEQKHGFFGQLAVKLAEAVGIEAYATILDVGCGNGISAQALHDRFGCKVLGVDLSPGMVAAGRARVHHHDIRFCVGDGEHLSHLVGEERFDAVLYNASIFIFPEVAKTLAEAHRTLRSGGTIAFSFYPQLVGQDGEDLFSLAFERLEASLPRFQVMTTYPAACKALRRYCTVVREHQWVRPLRIGFLEDFFSIPAQSASLFPGRRYSERRQRVHALFATLVDHEQSGRIVWRMAQGTKG